MPTPLTLQSLSHPVEELFTARTQKTKLYVIGRKYQRPVIYEEQMILSFSKAKTLNRARKEWAISVPFHSQGEIISCICFRTILHKEWIFPLRNKITGYTCCVANCCVSLFLDHFR